ncbi:hypothetical protein [Micromonospora echinaurantiaca]|uniref:hypothetical protein n=1 Tax=Micromonospora echinaurantiaca TaxID=47857 RepID=UPI0012FE78FC|nr:hypothetical protein [Micromonospora echinaurantiaca]
MRTTAAVSLGRWARLLLFVTLFGLAAMHTLGHDTHADHGFGAAGHGSAAADHGSAARIGPLADVPEAAAGHAAVAAVAGGTATVGLGAAHATGVRTAVDATVPGGCPAGCPTDRLLPSGGTGSGDLPGWAVCLAVLGVLAVSVLVAWLLLTLRRSAAPGARRVGRSTSPPRAPPPGPIGLRLTTVAVLRR